MEYAVTLFQLSATCNSIRHHHHHHHYDVKSQKLQERNEKVQSGTDPTVGETMTSASASIFL